MEPIDRRGFLRGLVGGAVVVTAAGAGVTLLSNVAEAAPVPADKRLPEAMEEFVEKVQHRHRYHRRRHWHHRPHYWHRRHWRRRRRRWHCWWHRGRRVCGWRYW